MIPYDQLVDRYHGLIFKLALGVVRNRADAEDIAQEVYVDLLRNPGALSGAQSEKAFIARCAINRAIKMRSGEQRRDRREAAVAGDRVLGDPSEQVFRRELRDQVAALPEGERVAVDLHYFSGFTLEETALALEIPPGTVSSRISSALDRLRKSLAAAAFAGLLAMLEGELSECGAVEVPAGLKERLRRLGDGSPVARPRSPGVVRSARVAVPLVFLVLLAGLIAFLLRRTGAGDGTREGGTVADTGSRDSGTNAEGTRSAAGGGSKATDAPDADPATAARPVRGQVVTRDLKPIPGAGVTLLLEVTGEPPREPSDVLKLPRGASATTDVSGEFTLALPEDTRATLRVHAVGFPDAFVRSRGPGDRVVVVMSAGATLEVRVTDAGGKPASDFPLQLIAGKEDNQDVLVILDGTTDAAGFFAFAAPAGGIAMVLADGCVFSESQRIVLPERGTVRMDITLGPVLALTGKVTDRETGAAISGARVGMSERDGTEAVTGKDGAYELLWRKDLRSRNQVHATAEGYGEESGQVGEGGTLDFQMSPCDAVAGRVVDGAGKPLAGASVVVQGNNPYRRVWKMSRHAVRTAADGRFTIRGLATDHAHRMIVHAARHGEIQRLLALHRDGRSGLVDIGDIVVPVPASVAGEFLSPSGAPIAKQHVFLQLVEPRGELTEESLTDGECAVVESRTLSTDSRGRFEFTDLCAGHYELYGRDTEGTSASLKFDLLEGQALTNATLQVKAFELARVRVVDPEGNPLAGVTVLMFTDSGAVDPVSDADGCMEVRSSPRSIRPESALRGRERLLLLHETEYLETAPGVIEVRITASPARTATGIVVDADGKPLAGAVVLLRLPQGGRLDRFHDSASSGDDGSFEMTAPAGFAAELELEPFKRGKALLIGATPWPVDVTKGLRIVATAAGTTRFAVEVVSPDGDPVAGVHVSAYVDIREPFGAGVTNEKGRFEFRDVQDVPLNIRLTPGEGDWLNSQGVRKAGEATFRAVLRHGVLTSGKILLPDGARIGKGWVVADRGALRISQGSIDAEGRFSVLLDPARDASQTITITISEPSELRGELADPEPGAQDLVIPVGAK